MIVILSLLSRPPIGSAAATVVEALRQHLGGNHDYAQYCSRAAPTRAAPTSGVVACTCYHWLSLLASIYGYIGGTSIVSYLFLVGACNAFCSSSIHPDHDQLAHL